MLCAVVALTTALGQDLGSANKLFGGPKSPRTAKNTTTARKPTPRPTIAKSKQKGSSSRSGQTEANASVTPPAAAKVRRSNEKIDHKKVSAADRARAEELVQQAESAFEHGDHVKAESLYKSARSIDPRDLTAVSGLGDIYREEQRWEEAENAYRAALDISPNDAAVNIALSYVLTQQLPVADLSDRYAEAQKLAARQLNCRPGAPLHSIS